MIDFIESIKGPTFLVLYALITVVFIIVLKMMKRFKVDVDMPLPEPTNFTHEELAFLKLRKRGLLESALYSLWRKNAVTVKDGNAKNALFSASTHNSEQATTATEKFLLEELKKPKLLSHIFAINKRNEKLKVILEKLDEKFERLKIIPDKEQRKKLKTTYIIIILMLLFLGITKLVLGISNERPVGFLVLLMILSQVILALATNSKKTLLTDYGKRFMEKTENRFAHLRQQKAEGEFSDGELLFAVAVFGSAPFWFGYSFAGTSSSFLADGYTSTGCSGGGCGNSGCGSDTSSSSGSGCSGSSCSSSSCSGGSCGGGGGGGCGGCGSS